MLKFIIQINIKLYIIWYNEHNKHINAATNEKKKNGSFFTAQDFRNNI
jgi:hypothetical protein